MGFGVCNVSNNQNDLVEMSIQAQVVVNIDLDFNNGMKIC